MILVTYDNIRLKCYINLCIVPQYVMGCSPILANAIDKFQSYLLKKNSKKSNFHFRLQNPEVTPSQYP